MADARLQAKRDVVKLPLYSTEEAFQSTPSPTGGNENNRQVLVNMFPIINKDPLRDDGGEVRLLVRPGLSNPNTSNSDLSTHLTLGYSEAMAVLGMRGTATEVLIVALVDYAAPNYFARIVQYRPDTSTILIGSINITSYGYSLPSDCSISLSEITHAGAPALAVTIYPRAARSTSSNSDGFYALTTSGYFTAASLTTIADVDWPTNATYTRGVVGPITQLNNVHYIMTADGFIHGSYPSNTYPFNADITTWDASGNTTASQDTDGGVSLVRYKHHLIAFGTSSMEFFNDEGLAKPNLPILRTQQAYTRIGLANSKAWTIVDDELYWLGVSQDTGSIGLYRLSGYTPELVSSPPMNHLLAVYGRYDGELYAYQTLGTTHIITNVSAKPLIDCNNTMGADTPDNNELLGTWVYCVTSKAWWIWAFEQNEFISDILTFGNSTVPQLRIAVTANGLAATRWVWVCGYDSVNEDVGMHPIKMFQTVESQFPAYYDKFRVNSGSTYLTYRIPTAIRTNRIQFGSLNRKTIHRARLQSVTLTDVPSSYYVGEDWKLYMSMWKNTAADSLTGQETPSITRTIDLEIPANNPYLTYYNFGTCRSAVFQFLSNNAYLTEYGHLELVLSLADN